MSLYYLLIYDVYPKIKINICNTLALLIDQLPIKLWIGNFDIRQIEKIKKNAFASRSFMLYTSL